MIEFGTWALGWGMRRGPMFPTAGVRTPKPIAGGVDDAKVVLEPQSFKGEQGSCASRTSG